MKCHKCGTKISGKNFFYGRDDIKACIPCAIKGTWLVDNGYPEETAVLKKEMFKERK